MTKAYFNSRPFLKSRTHSNNRQARYSSFVRSHSSFRICTILPLLSPKGATCNSEGQRPGKERNHHQDSKTPTGRNRISIRLSLIPNISFIIFDVVFLQKFDVLLLKCFLAMVFFLIGDIPFQCLDVRLSYSQCRITTLPIEIPIERAFGFDPY